MRGKWKVHNNLQAYYFPQQQLEKMQGIVFSYATKENIEDVKDIYNFLSMFFSDEKENNTFQVKMGIDSKCAKWTLYPKETFDTMPIAFSFLIEKTDTGSTVTLYLEKLCV